MHLINIKWFYVSLCMAALLLTSHSQELPCTSSMSINIDDGILLNNNSILHQDVVYGENEYYFHESGTRGCICLLRPCLMKCCPPGYTYGNSSCEENDDPRLTPFAPPIYNTFDLIPGKNASEHFHIIPGVPCEGGSRYALIPDLNEADAFFLQPDGQLLVPQVRPHAQGDFCVELFLYQPKTNILWPDEKAHYVALACLVEEEEESTLGFVVFPIGVLISTPFLLATFLVYAFVPELRNLHGRCLMNYVFGLFGSFVLLAVNQLTSDIPEIEVSIESCHTIAFFMYFFFILTFFWLNVMCIDIWLTFRGFRVPRIGRRSAETRRFMFYCLYAWGSSAVLLSIVVGLQYHPDVPAHIMRPNFGEVSCWFEDKKRELVFFYTPLMILFIINLLLFTNTSLKIVQINRETAMLQTGDSMRHDQYDKDKQRFKLYLKLFLVMGINWITELLSFIIGGSQWIWMLSDIMNTAIGIYIFIAFVWRRKVKNLIVKRYRFLRYGSTITQTRTSSRYHTTNMVTSSIGETDKTFVSETTNIKMKELV